MIKFIFTGDRAACTALVPRAVAELETLKRDMRFANLLQYTRYVP